MGLSLKCPADLALARGSYVGRRLFPPSLLLGPLGDAPFLWGQSLAVCRGWVYRYLRLVNRPGPLPGVWAFSGMGDVTP